MSGYAGKYGNSVQTGYADQPFEGFPGQLATATDYPLINHYPAKEDLKIGVGVVVGDALTVPASGYYNIDAPYSVKMPVAGSVAADFVGITLRNEAGRCDANGEPIVQAKDIADVVNEGFVLVKANVAVTGQGKVYMIIKDTTSHGFAIGSFVTSTQGGDAIEVSRCRWHMSAKAGGVAIIEIARK